MSEDEVGEIRDELKAYKEQLYALKSDMEVIILFASPHVLGQVKQYVTGVPSALPVVREKCVRFLERYGSLVK